MSKVFRFLYRHWKFTLCIVTLLLVALAIRRLSVAIEEGVSPVEVSIESDNRIGPTPAQITSIKRIGRWEFLSVQMEEIVDTTHKRVVLSDEQLVRIYRGTVRLGIDLEKAKDDWFEAHGDTALLRLPPIQQLNRKFIDEANTRTFYETGSWDNKAREQMYQKARRRMLARLRESHAYEQAETNGREQMTALMRGLGYRHVEVVFR